MDLEELYAVLKRGGFPGLCRDKFSLAMMGWRDHTVFATNMYGSNKFYCFGDPTNMLFKNYQDQSKSIHKRPRISPGYFLGENRTAVVKEAVKMLRQEGLCDRQPLTPPDITTTTEAECQTTSTSLSESSHASCSDKCPTSSIRTGIKMVDIDTESAFLSEFQSHAVECGHRMHQSECKKIGFDNEQTWECSFCQTKLIQRSGWDIQRKEGQRGARTHSGLNLSIVYACYEAGVSPEKALELFGNAGVQSLTKHAYVELQKHVKEAALDVSDKQLSANRREHVTRTRESKDYEDDMMFISTDGKQRSIAQGSISADGCGSVRAYGHKITGSQHGLVIYSCETDKPLYVECDQISCWGCSHKLTEHLLKTGKKVFDLQDGEVDYAHEGRCYRNSKYSPAQAEEFAMESAAEYLLNLPDDEAIFGKEVCADGDTRGTTHFIRKQKDIIGKNADDVSEYFPDIGHFIKCISNGLYNIAKEDPTLKGRQLLEPSRIKAISGDIRRHLCWYHKAKAKSKTASATDHVDNNHDHDEQACNLRKICLEKINSIIAHHCGDHSGCRREDCVFLDCMHRVRSRYEVDHDGVIPEEVILQQTNKLYSKNARFRGKLLSLDAVAQKKVQNVISSRLNEKNVDRVAKLMSSNRCENFFSVLVKYTEGKRLNLSQLGHTASFCGWHAK